MNVFRRLLETSGFLAGNLGKFFPLLGIVGLLLAVFLAFTFWDYIQNWTKLLPLLS